MSLRSMTGYGRGQASSHGIRMEVEISSVNRRQLDILLSLPRSLGALEAHIQEEVHQVVSRGRVRVEMSVSRAEGSRSGGIRVDAELAAAYVKELRKTAHRLGLRDDFSGSLLLTLPNVVQVEEITGDAEGIWPLARTALRRALKAFLEMKAREGEALHKELDHRLDLLEQRLDRVRKRAPQVAKNHRKALRARLEEAGVGLKDADDRLLREVAFFADRSDITEETTRLGSHIGQGRQIMRSPEPAGKSLDFLAQEMFREINTIGSKANDAVILRHVVAFKTELERIREQVQNIE